MSYSIFFVISILISASLIPALIFFSKKRNLFDFSEGDELKIHKRPISFLGGVAMFAASNILFLFLSFQNIGYLYIALAGLVIFLLGLWDDLKWKHISSRKPYLKFFFLVSCSLGAALLLYFAGIEFHVFSFLSFFYIFVLINAINYQDGMDGQAGTMVLISLIGFCFLSVISGNNFSLLISMIFLGALLGFLFFNFPPAKIFMGDSGAYFLGFGLALLSIIFSGNILSHLFIIGVPLFDGVYTNIRRLFSSKSIFLGDRDHFYDKMLKRGFSPKKTILTSAILQIVSVTIGVLIFIYV